MVDLAPFTVTAQSSGEASQLADETTPRFILGMPEEVYHARPEISASGLKVVRRSPLAYQHSRSVRVEKPEFDLGHAIHARVLGVGLPVAMIPSSLLSGPHLAVQSKAAKEYVEQIRAEGKTPLKPAAFQHVMRASDAVLTHPKAGPLLERPGMSEVSMFADIGNGVRMRGRIDRLTETDLIDVKTTTDLSTRKLQRVVEDFCYDLSAEAYRLLFEVVTGVVSAPMTLIFVEKEAPYDVRVVVLGDDWIEYGFRRLREALDVYADCVRSGVWPGVDVDELSGIQELPAPGWIAAQVRAEEAA